MDFIDILQAGVASGTVLLFATLGEVLAERSGVLNLGVEGMMLIGAMSAFSVGVRLDNPWLGVIVAMLVAGLLSQIHAFIAIGLQADQVVSGLALTFVGTGVSLVLGRGPEQGGCRVPAAVVDRSGPVGHSGARPDLLHEPERPGVRRLLDDAAGLVLHQSDPAGTAPARRGGVPGGSRCPGHQRVSHAVRCTSSSAACWQVWQAPPSAWRFRPDGSAS